MVIYRWIVLSPMAVLTNAVPSLSNNPPEPSGLSLSHILKRVSRLQQLSFLTLLEWGILVQNLHIAPAWMHPMETLLLIMTVLFAAPQTEGGYKATGKRIAHLPSLNLDALSFVDGTGDENVLAHPTGGASSDAEELLEPHIHMATQSVSQSPYISRPWLAYNE